MEDILKIKIASGVALWIISLVCGILLPFLIWRSSSEYYRRTRTNRARSIHLTNNETIHLIDNDDFVAKSSCFYGLRNTMRRLLSWIKVTFSKGIILSIANCVCSGVFIGICLLDLIPQSRKDVDEILVGMKKTTDFPVSEFAISIGLLLIMSTENLAMQFCLPQHNKKNPAPNASSNSVVETTADTSVLIEETRSPQAQDIAVYRNYILAATLSLHSIFEGLAIGLQHETASLVEMFIAISVHKAVLTFGIGLRLFETLGECGKIRAATICAFIFCTASPIGCAIGASVSSTESSGGTETVDSSQIASAILQSLATGTFLYVTFVEVIPSEFAHSDEDHEHEPKSEPVGVVDEQPQSSMSNGRSTHLNSEPPTPSNEHKHEVRSRKANLPRIAKLFALLIGFGAATALQCL